MGIFDDMSRDKIGAGHYGIMPLDVYGQCSKRMQGHRTKSGNDTERTCHDVLDQNVR